MTLPSTLPRIGATGAEGTGPRQPGLILVFPDVAGRAIAFDEPPVILGRDGQGPAQLDGTEVSRRHAEVRQVGPLSLVRDCGSTNGTYVNGRAMSESPLRPGDVVRLGEWIGVVVADVPAAQGQPLFQALAPNLYVGPALARALVPVKLAAASGLPMVIEGETGTGKECVARAIHGWSGRTGPFVGLNCAALPEAMAEAELFGHRKGAFTGADRSGLGHLRAADGGTLLLDEVIELPMIIQAKLLRALEQREVVPLGETKPVPFDVQLISAAQIPLQRAVEEKRFRPDLLARLEGLTIRLPPLRERLEDVAFLFTRLLKQHAGGSPPAIAPRLIEQLCLYDWPLNVRELDLLVRRLLTVSADASLLRPSALPDRIRTASRAVVAGIEAAGPPRGAAVPQNSTDDVLAASLAAALKTSGGNVARAAQLVGISRQRAYRLIEISPQLDLGSLRKDSDNPRVKSRSRRSAGGSE